MEVKGMMARALGSGHSRSSLWGKAGWCVQVSRGDGASPFNVILFCLVGLVGCLDIVSLAHHSDVTLHIALQPGRDVIRVRQDGPFVVELVLCSGKG